LQKKPQKNRDRFILKAQKMGKAASKKAPGWRKKRQNESKKEKKKRKSTKG